MNIIISYNTHHIVSSAWGLGRLYSVGRFHVIQLVEYTTMDNDDYTSNRVVCRAPAVFASKFDL